MWDLTQVRTGRIGRGRRGSVIGAAMVIMACGVGGARAQSGPTVALDAAALVGSSDVLPTSISDPVWQVDPQPGRRLMQLPLLVTPGEEAGTLTAPPIDIRGGRFIAWRIVPDDGRGGRGGGFMDAGMGDFMDAGMDAGMDPGMDFYPGSHMRGGRGFGQQPRASMQDVQPGQPLPQGAPLLTRSLTVNPNGTISWSLERSVPGATVKEGMGYALKLRPDLLAAQEPPRPERVDPGNDPRAAAQRRRQQEHEHRQAMMAFRDLRDQVRDLPEQFETTLPPRLWAVFEVAESLPTLTLRGPDDAEDLPWTLRFDEFQALRDLASGAARRGGMQGAAFQQVGLLLGMARGGQPMSHRAIAMALDQAGLIQQVQMGDSLYQLLQVILSGPDAEAQRVVVTALAMTDQPTHATTTLLRDAAANLSPQVQLLSLRGLFQGVSEDPQQLREMLANVNRTLAAPNGPDAGLVLDAMVEGVRGTDRRRGGPEDHRPTPALITGVDFESLPPARLDEAIAYVIRAAGTRPLAAAWLNHRLLGASNPAVAHRTLELLSRAGGGAGVFRPVGHALLSLVFTQPETESPNAALTGGGTSTDGAGGNGGTGGSGATASRLNLTLSGPILLDSLSHTYFRAINSGDPQVRELAWRALPNFTLAVEDHGRRGRNAPSPASDEVVSTLLSAGLSQEPTPTALATFLARQKMNPRATSGLIELVLFSDQAAVRQAARSLLGSGRNIAEALLAVPVDQRAEFGSQLYLASRDHAPLVTGLLADPQGDQIVRWFGQQVAAGDLPEPAAWAAQYQGDDDLLQRAASHDRRLADGAVGALVAAAGGDEQTARDLSHRLAAADDRTPAGLAAAWGPVKTEIYARRLASAVGDYRLIVRIGQSSQQGGAGDPYAYDPMMDPAMDPGMMDPMMDPGMPMASGYNAAAIGAGAQVIAVGIVPLSVEGQAVFLGNQTVNFTLPQERLALRLTPNDLKNLRNEELAQVPLEQVSQPMDLLPQDDGSWRGQAPMPGGSLVEVVLEPTAE